MTELAEVIQMTPCRSVEIARRQEVDAWELADAVYDDIEARLPDEGMPSSGAHGVRTGLKAAEDALYEIHKAAGTEIGRSYVHNLYVTRRSWPPDERAPELASFDAHFELRGKEYRHRRQIIERLAAKSATGRASRQQVVLYKVDRKPAAHRTFLQLVDGRVRAALKSAAQPWHTVSDGDRESIAHLLHKIAREVEDGTFPNKAAR